MVKKRSDKAASSDEEEEDGECKKIAVETLFIVGKQDNRVRKQLIAVVTVASFLRIHMNHVFQII